MADAKYKLFAGIDFGISKVSIVTSLGLKKVIEKLPESYKGLFIEGKYNFFETLKGQNTEGSKDHYIEDIKDIIGELLSSAIDPAALFQTACIITSSKSGIYPKSIKLLESLVGEYIDVLGHISSPFATGYSLRRQGHYMILDIGANTVDICRFYSTLPASNDEMVLYKAGNFINKRLSFVLKKKFGVDFTDEHTINLCKERYGSVSGKIGIKIKIKFIVNNKVYIYDIANEVREACLSIVPDIVKEVKRLISTYDPEFKDELIKNVILSGRGSLLKGLVKSLETELKECGEASVMYIDDPLYSPAIGAMYMAKDISSKDKDLEVTYKEVFIKSGKGKSLNSILVGHHTIDFKEADTLN